MRSLALTNALKYFRIVNNELIIGGRRISAIAKEHQPPFYIYDLSVAREKVRRLRSALPDEIEIHYAIKANPHPQILAFFSAQGLGFDVASEQELRAAIAAGAQPETCGFAGPGKSKEEIAFAIQNGIQSLNVESETELRLANEIAGQMQKRVNVALRINPPFSLKRSGMQMSGGPSFFGIDSKRIPALLSELTSLPYVDFKGFHIFAGSQNLNTESLIKFFNNAFRMLRELAASSPVPVQLINLGGGFGIPYFQADAELDIEFVGKALDRLLQENRKFFPETRFIIETGRYLVGECGIYVTRVQYKKESRGKVFLVGQGGLNHHLAATGNFGQAIRKNYPIAALMKLDMQTSGKFNIAGPLCTPLDVLGSDVDLPEVSEGDLLGIFASGAYGYTASPVRFLSHPEPAEIVVDE